MITCGAEDWKMVSYLGKKKLSWLKLYIPLPHGIPSQHTFIRVFERIDPDEFRQCFITWVSLIAQRTHGEVIAIDGKTLRRSYDKGSNKAAIHMVNAWASQTGMVLGQLKTSEKSNEIKAIQLCRTSGSGMTLLECNGCGSRDQKPMSCGHRNCNRCQNTDTSQWLARQSQKLLPVEYFMVTFTLPAQLRTLAWQNQRTVYDLLFRIASDTLKEFGANPKNMDADLGMTGVLHTHSRRLDYHPHVHFVVPGGGINTRKNEWRKLKGKYLFNGKNLAKVFRAKLLKALDEHKLLSATLKSQSQRNGSLTAYTLAKDCLP